MKPGDRVLHRWEDRGLGVVVSTTIAETVYRGQVVSSYPTARVKWTGGPIDSSDVPVDSLKLADIVTAIGRLTLPDEVE